MRSNLLALATIGLFLMAGCAGAGATAVELDDNYFQVVGKPATKNGDATAKVGEKWKFDNDGTHTHTVTVHWVGDAATTTMKNQTLAHGASTDFTFAKAGTFHVWCTIHGAMTSGMHITVKVA
jgi:plastocyanin